MITIVKDGSKLVVTRGTYEEQYKALGYQIASEKKEATKKVASFVEEEKEDKQEKTLEEISVEDKKEKEDLTDKYGLNLGKKTNTSKRGKK